MSEDIKKIVKRIEIKALPFTDKLVEKGMKGQADQILGLIHAIEENTLTNCSSLYLILQSSMFDEIEAEGEDAAESLSYLYNLMTRVYGGAVLDMIMND